MAGQLRDDTTRVAAINIPGATATQIGTAFSAYDPNSAPPNEFTRGVFVAIATQVTATQLTVTQQPPTTVPTNTAFTVLIEARDAGGVLDNSYTGNVTIALTPGTGTPGAILGGTTTVAAVGGVATFNDLTVDTAGTGYTLSATSDALTPVTTSAFDVT